MSHKTVLADKIQEMDNRVTFKQMFGQYCFLINKKLIGGIKEIDDNVIKIFLIFDETNFIEVIDSGLFTKFEYGKTWAEVEITSEEEVEQIWPYLNSAYIFAKSR